MRLINADALYERLKADEELARDRVIDTPSSFPNGTVNPSAIRYMAQLSERTRFKEIVFDAPTIEERKTGHWIDAEWVRINTGEKRKGRRCSACGSGFFRYDVSENTVSDIPNYCPNCGADMRGGNKR